jgi:Putative 2OG-Fe(II) oxygenase/Tetratricopeptide repeat
LPPNSIDKVTSAACNRICFSRNLSAGIALEQPFARLNWLNAYSTFLDDFDGLRMLWHEDLHSGKHLSTVIDLARKATALRPDIVKNWLMLASFLIQAGEDEQAIAVLTDAISKLPPDPGLDEMLARTAGRVGLPNEVPQQAPRIAGNETQLANDALALNPLNSQALAALGRLSRNNGQPQVIVPFCKTALERDPGHSRARYELAVAFAMLGRSEQARQLIDLNRFIEVIDLDPPETYATAERFENALASEITCNPTLKADPVDKATKGGFQTSGLPQLGDCAISTLLDLIRLTVDSFELNLPGSLKDPFVTARPKQAWLHAWAVVYPGDGRQTSHIHDDGWLTGVYYVSVPKTSPDSPRRGSLVLGSLEYDGTGIDPPWGTREIRPVPGRLVLFPSYVPHATLPTKSADPRICVSFDVVAAARSRTPA